MEFQQEKLAKYLKFGFTKDVSYGDVVPCNNYEWNEAKNIFLSILKPKIKKDYVYAFSGTATSTMYISLIGNVKTVSVYLPNNNCKKISEYYKCQYFETKFKNIERCLIEFNRLWDQPRCTLGDIYAYTRSSYLAKMGFIDILCEGATDQLLFGDPNKFLSVMLLALKRNDYNLKNALNIKNVFGGHINLQYNNSYLNSYFNNSTIFSDNDLIKLDLPVPEIKLKNDTLGDFSRFLFDWHYNLTKSRNEKFNDYFGLNIYSPFEDDDLRDFCLSLPMEMKFCLGSGKYIMKETIKLPDKIKKMLMGSIYSKIYEMVYREELFDKYLGDKSKKIYEMLDYDVVQSFTHFLKKWQLLNLSIWLEEHK